MDYILCFAILATLLLPASTGRETCPIVCRCDRRHTVYCNERNRDLIPYGIPLNTHTLHLQRNNIPNGRRTNEILSSLKYLKKLDLHQNILTSVPIGLASTLEYIDFKNNLIKYVGKKSLKGLTSLKELHLGENNITNVGLTSFAFQDTQSLSVLTLSNNRLTEFPKNLPVSLQTLQLNNNQIKAISLIATLRLKNLVNLDLSYNFIVQSMIEPGAFKGFSSLQRLDLSHNQLNQVPARLPGKLKSLMLGKNRIEYLYSSENSQHGSLNSVGTLESVDLSSNRLKSVETESFSSLTLATIELHNNPWQCDCRLQYLKRWLVSEVTTLSNEGNIRCATPTDFAGVMLSSIDAEALTCATDRDARNLIKIVRVNSTGFTLRWKSPFQTPDPPFIKRSIVYGPLKCKNCTLDDVLASDRNRDGDVMSIMESISSQKISSNGPSSNIVVRKLLPNSRYAVCVFDSQQENREMTSSNCLDVKTLPSPVAVTQNDNAVFIPIWIVVVVGLSLVTIIIITVVIIFCKKGFKSKTPRTYYATNRDDDRHIEANLPAIPPAHFRSSVVRSGYATNLSDRTYAECGPAAASSTGQRTLPHNRTADPLMEFDGLIKSQPNDTSPGPTRSAISSSGSEYQETGTLSTNHTDMSSNQSSAISSPAYDLLHSYQPMGVTRMRTGSLPIRSAIDSGIYI